MKFATLEEWLQWQEHLHPKSIDLGLQRPGEILARMQSEDPPFTVITVGGTNGKGSSVAFAEAILSAAGYRVGSYTSPHLMRYNERVRVNCVPVSDQALCNAFERVEQARGDISLTYFEFGTLAAIDVFYRERVDVVLMEVGLGGRLDAVNLLDPDVSVITSIGLDHQAWLGETRESIAVEKAGIFRAGRPAVCVEEQIPETLLNEAERLAVPLYRLGSEFGFTLAGEGWTWWSKAKQRHALPAPALRGSAQWRNAAGVLMALELLGERIPVNQQAVREGLRQVTLPGRFQVLSGEPTVIVDVAHNPQAAEELAINLQRMVWPGRTLAVMAMLEDKDAGQVARVLKNSVDRWYVAGLSVGRGLSAQRLARRIEAAGVKGPQVAGRVVEGLAMARSQALPGDRVVVFGSFHTVAEVLGESV